MKSKVRTTVICPSFIDTGMFEGVKMKFALLTPLLSEKYAAWRIVTGIRQNEQFIVMPYIIQLLLCLKDILPTSVGDWLTKVFGGLEAMDHFQGRR